MSEETGLSVSWFDRAAWCGEGPPFIKSGHDGKGVALYRWSDWLNWLECKKQRSTSDKGTK
jgi:hypothetical protein